jgi:hypothetical protein
MPPRLRKFIGMVMLVTFVIVYAFVAMVIGDMTMQNRPTGVQFLYFAVAGLLWTIPAGAIMWWMDKPERMLARARARAEAEALTRRSDAK